jgi:hypothetical protein
MFSLFKKKKSWVRFYCLDQNVALVYPVIQSKLVDRDWNGLATTKRNRPEQGKQVIVNCPAIKQISRVGYVITAPADFIIRTASDHENDSWEAPFAFKRESDKYSFGGNEYYVSWHSPAQTEPVIPRVTINTNKPYLQMAVKVETPWRLKSSDDIVFLQIPVSYNNEERFSAAVGIVDPRYMHSVTVQLFWHVMEGETLVRAGTPLAQLVPISRSLLEEGAVDFIVDVAGAPEREIEQAYAYCNHSRFPKTDTVTNKIRIITQLFEYFRKKFPKSKI